MKNKELLHSIKMLMDTDGILNEQATTGTLLDYAALLGIEGASRAYYLLLKCDSVSNVQNNKSKKKTF